MVSSFNKHLTQFGFSATSTTPGGGSANHMHDTNGGQLSGYYTMGQQHMKTDNVLFGEPCYSAERERYVSVRRVNSMWRVT